MRSHVAAFALLGSVSASPADVSDYKAALGTATYCITYESTYLAPISIGANSSEADVSATEEPGFPPSDSASLPLFESTQEALTTGETVNTEDPAVNTEEPTAVTDTPPVDTDQPTLTTVSPEDTEEPSLPTASTATQPVFEPTGQRVIFQVTPAGELTKRDIGGFVGDGNPDVCTFASVYTLGQGQLFVGDVPFSYSGEEFQSLDSASTPGEGAISRTFSNDGGILSFANRGLPGGRASFCQDPLDGQVYITYRSRPSGCVFVTLSVYGVERCINGKIDGLDDPTTTGLTQSQDAQTTGSPVTAIDPGQSTDIDVPEESETNLTATTEIDVPGETGTESLQTTQDNVPEQSETDSPQTTKDDVPEQTETDLPENTDTPPDVKTTTGGIVLPTWSTFRTWNWANTSFTAPPNAETTRLAASADVLSSTDIEDEDTTTVEDLDTSTTLEPTTGDPTSTTGETTTTMEAAIETFFSLTQNGDFRNGLDMWAPQGITSELNEGCYKADGSLDDSCATLGSADGGARIKRGADSFSEIAQLITGLEFELSTYVLQFYYYVQTVSGSGCTLQGKGGEQDFATKPLVSSDVGSWKLARGSVIADVERASVKISLTCTSGSQANVKVDSVFVSNEVTEDNIDEYKLSFENEEA
ncbi:uncharacterized protein FIESC28_04704 [Fusarium coffeatum]|uniref:DUF7908 domain-containing protein n=1 Tax=Fusarium coffeatum TaxID=231269 RepID=A0A366RXR8_9HYPO|nr:uncharacterized protein FIESC28_04704 [Fusarium coffeatum]RBR21861.1 hypothetical protein FIESC28_04704 [Fusarium coffeatum]